jgi:exodeoxyribonuclease V alpha subunit
MLESKVAILTGGPGTGKTSLVRAVLTSLEPLELKVALAAPTGRAGRRLFESTGHEATTIHRLLEADAQRGFARNADRPIEVDLLILDEASMIDLLLMEAVLEALPDHAALLLVGDKDQLPSVGPGTLLRDLIESGTVDVVRLEDIFRQEKESLIVVNAHRVNQGLSTEVAKQITGLVRDLKLKVTTQIQDQQVRVQGKNRDDLQAVMQMLKSNENVDVPLQYVNMKS